jgi:hypothetical protein
VRSKRWAVGSGREAAGSTIFGQQKAFDLK